MDIKKPIVIPSWIAIIIVLLIIVLLSGGGYGFKEYRSEKKAFKDSLEYRKLEIYRLEEAIYDANEFENTEAVTTDKFRSRYYNELKKRKDAEKELSMFKNYSRIYIDSFLTNYKYRGNK